MPEQKMMTRHVREERIRLIPSAHTATPIREGRKENDRLLDAFSEVSVVEARPTPEDKKLGEQLRWRVNGSDLQWLCLVRVRICKSSNVSPCCKKMCLV